MLKLIPKPQQIREKEGIFCLEDTVKVYGEISDNIFLQLSNTLLPYAGSKVEKADKEDNIYGINFIRDNSIKEEGYNLTVKEDGITIVSSTDNGAFYAIMTLCQIIYEYNKKIPFVEIEDYPRFNYRSFMLDVGRYFFPVKDVKSFIDIAALLKLNILHLHLTEDQGWRVQIDKYPLLTEQGSKRSHTNFNHTPHEGFFTKEDIREIVNYAHTKYIKVIPEIDMPGHMESAISCYKYLSCFDREIEVATHFGVKHDILCAGKDSTYEFVKDVLSEIMELFPDGYIHLGGDEAVKVRWDDCPNCQKRMKELGVDADGLQSVFLDNISKFNKENGYKTIIWNETREDENLNSEVIWNFYMDSKNTREILVKEMNKGRKFINVSDQAYYYDLPYHDIPLKNAYNYEPMIEEISEENKDKMLGVECDLWTEYVPNMKVASKKLFPRMFAMAESSWLNPENKNYQEFTERLEVSSKIVYSITGYEQTPVNKANPGAIRGAFEKMWFEKRQLHWEGLKILLEDRKVSREAKKINKE